MLLDCINTAYRDLPENRAEMLRILSELSKTDNLTFRALWRRLRVVVDSGMQPPTLISKFASQGAQGLAGDRPNLEPYDWVFSDQLGMFQIFTPAGITDRRLFEESMGALRTDASNYDNLSGRKNLIWISQGFPVFAGQSLTGVAVYPVDSRYLSTTDADSSSRADMQAVAKETGGMAYLTRRDVAKCVREALNDSRITYWLKYTVPGFKYDGSSHSIKIETTRKGAKLRYRQGCYAPPQAPK